MNRASSARPAGRKKAAKLAASVGTLRREVVPANVIKARKQQPGGRWEPAWKPVIEQAGQGNLHPMIEALVCFGDNLPVTQSARDYLATLLYDLARGRNPIKAKPGRVPIMTKFERFCLRQWNLDEGKRLRADGFTQSEIVDAIGKRHGWSAALVRRTLAAKK